MNLLDNNKFTDHKHSTFALAINRLSLLPVLFYFAILSTSCNSTEPEDNKSITLSVLDVSCTEVWIDVRTKNINLPGKLNLLLDGELIGIIPLMVKDTVIMQRYLQPSSTHTYQVSKNGRKSNIVTFTTLDTTSSNYTWEKHYFGNIGSSHLSDVWIFDENNIWAVGEILIQENSDDYKIYAIAKWDGIRWELEQVEFAHYPEINKRPGKLNAIFVLDEENIFVATASQLLKWDGETWIQLAQFATAIPFYGQVKEIWGNSKDNIYCAGNNGTIYHYYGTGWSKLDSNTDLDIQDIWGDYNESKDEWEILAVASNMYENNGNKLLKIDGEEVIDISNNGLPWSIKSVWFDAKRSYSITGDGYFTTNNLGDLWIEKRSFPLLYKHSIRGQALNSVAICGAFGLVSYFNGQTWNSFEHPEQQKYISIDIEKDILVAVGSSQGIEACLTIGTR